MSHPATPPGDPSGDGGVRPADPIHGAHDTYPKGEPSSIGDLVGDISRDISTLMRQEVALAKAEVKESAKNAGTGAGMFGGAAVAGYLTVLFLSIAVWWWLGELMDRGLAALIVAVLWGIIAAVLAMVGKKKISQVEGIPQTMETAKAVPDALKGNEDRP